MQAQVREKGFAAASSVAAAVFLTSMKLVIGLMTGSLGILAEAAHSALDLIAALITLFAVRVSDRPADDSHPYGHGKVENLSALAEAFLLLITCAWIIYEAVNRSRMLSRAAKKYHSQALEADALHFSTDIWSSSVVLVGLALVWYGEASGQSAVFVRADAVAALFVALIVIFVSLRLGRRMTDALLDRAPHGLADHISVAVAQVHNVRRVNRVRVRDVGSQTFVDLGVAVPRYLSFEESHTVTDQVQAAVRTVSPNADVVVHAFPISENEGVLERIQAIAAQGYFAIHNVTTHWTARGIWIDLDLEVDPNLTLDRAHALATDLELKLRAEFDKTNSEGLNKIADINVHIEPRAEELIKGSEIRRKAAEKYIRQIEAIRSELPRTHSVQDIQLQNLNGKVYLSFHLILDSDCPISEVHSLAEEMENRLRREFPQLGRVVIHAEPHVSKT